MAYKRLPFEQYYVDQSLGNYGGVPQIHFEYNKVEYKGRFLKHDAFYKVLYDNNRQVYQIYFKETCTKSQWIANFTFPKKHFDSFQYKGKDIQLKAAKGWSELYSALKWYIRNDFRALLKEHGKKPVEIIGWSLGSAIAQLCAQDLFFNYGIRAHVFTFGSVKPWCGKDQVMKEYLLQSCEECWNFADHNDIVGYMVPLPKYFKVAPVKIKQNKFCLFRLFKPTKYHCEYWKSEYYKDIK